MDLDYYFMLKENKSKFTVAGIVLVPVFLYLASIWRRPFFAPLEDNGAAVDAINAGALEETICLNLDTTQCRSRVGREVRIRCSATDDNYVAVTQVLQSLILRVVLADRLHTD